MVSKATSLVFIISATLLAGCIESDSLVSKASESDPLQDTIAGISNAAGQARGNGIVRQDERGPRGNRGNNASGGGSSEPVPVEGDVSVIGDTPTSGDEVVSGGGDEVVSGGGDEVASGGGDEVVSGGGDDVASGGGDEVVSGGGDEVVSGGGDDVASGGGDEVASGGGDEVASGGGDEVASGGGDDVASGGGDDVASGDSEQSESTNLVEEVRLSWVAPTTRMNGEPLKLSEINGYRVYYGNSPDNTPNIVVVADSTQTQSTISLEPGLYYFKISAYDTDGIEGPKSPAIGKQI